MPRIRPTDAQIAAKRAAARVTYTPDCDLCLMPMTIALPYAADDVERTCSECIAVRAIIAETDTLSEQRANRRAHRAHKQTEH